VRSEASLRGSTRDGEAQVGRSSRRFDPAPRLCYVPGVIRRLVLVALLSATATARADDIVAYQADGDAATNVPDPRVAAIDEALAHATSAALVDLVAADVRTAHKADLDREIIGHARLWAKSYNVTKDDTTDGRRVLSVSVRIDRDKLRARLGELSIATKDTQAEAPPGQIARTVTILLRVGSPGGVHADFGATADKDLQGVAALTNAFRTAGMAVRRAPASGPALRTDGELPVSDDEASALAGDAKAELAAIAAASVAPAVPVRGVAQPAALVTAKIRLIEKGGKVLGEGTAATAARGEDPGLVAYAIDRALLTAMADVLPPAPKKLAQAGAYHGQDIPVPEAGVVLVRLAPKTPFGMVQSELKYLAGAKGVRAASLRRLSPGGWVIGVQTTEPLEKIASIAKRPPATDTSADVKIVGDLVEVTLSGSP
jgi:hypothetical protein